jgi:hypothetical protein
MTNNEALTLAMSVLALFVSAIFPAWAIYQNTAAHQLSRHQKELMRAIGAKAIILCDAYTTILNAAKHELSIDPFFFPYVQLTAKRLEEDIDKAISAGLETIIITKRKHSLVLHTLFSQSLHQVANAKLSEVQQLLLKEHFMFGLVRIVEQCQKYNPNGLTCWLESVPFHQEPDLPWTYLMNKTEEKF